MKRQAVISDASCLVVLQNIQELTLLQKLFGEVLVTEAVEKEYNLALPEWIKVKTVQNKTQQNRLNSVLDAGEAGAIALSLETADSLLIIDEKKGRRIARESGVKIIGTLGVILLAKEKGLTGSIEDLLEKLENAGFYISPGLKAKVSEA